MRQDPESRSRTVLTKQRDPVDRHRPKIQGCEAMLQQGDKLVAPLRREFPGERHVETEVVHHIGVAPAIEMINLRGREHRRFAARAIFRRYGFIFP